ncbi:MAG: penicillin-binding transpeptidase domain-containing protein [Pyrinomonadaceae bacterium]
MFFFSSKLYFKLLSGLLSAAFVFALSSTVFPQKLAPQKQTSGKRTPPVLKTITTKTKNARESSAATKRKAEETRKAEAAEKARREQAARAVAAASAAREETFRQETVRNISEDDTLGEDPEIRRAAVNALGSHAGTIVVMEPQTGKVLTIVNQEWAIRRSFKPCSTVKLVTAVAGINEDLIDDEGNIRSRKFKLGLDDALAYSNNSYFQAVGSGLGSPKLISYAQQLGLGQPTGINADDETAGRLPFGNENPRIYSHGDDFEVTPLQLGVLVSAISNGGKLVIPQIPRSKVQKTSFRGYMRRTVNLPQKNLKGVIPGMIGAASYGTARRGMPESLGVAGKTGSCIEKGSWVGLFASVAPVVNPQYAVVVITRGRGERGRVAAAIAGQIYQVLGKRIKQNGNRNLAKTPLILRPQPKVNATTSAEIDTDAGQDSDDAEPGIVRKKAPAKTPPAPARTAENKSKRKTENKTDKKSDELFPPVVIEVKSATTRPRVVRKN